MVRIKEVSIGYEKKAKDGIAQKVCTCDCLCDGALGIGESYCSGKSVAIRTE